MKEYTVRLPCVDEHEQEEEFVKEILEASNGVDDDARPVFVTKDPNEALLVVKRVRLICRRYSCDEASVSVVTNDV